MNQFFIKINLLLPLQNIFQIFIYYGFKYFILFTYKLTYYKLNKFSGILYFFKDF